jgi:hypothetical protein
MAKLTKKEIKKLDKQAAFYKWEFMRRNENYGKELKQLIAGIAKREKVSPSEPKFEAAYNWVRSSREQFAKRWGLVLTGADFPLPKKEFKSLSLSQKSMLLPYATDPGWPKFYSMANLMAKHKVKIFNFPIYDEKTIDSINIGINLRYPHRVIMLEVEYIVRIMKSLRKKKGFRDNVKHHYAVYSDFLKIYDLRENENMKFKNIWAKVLKKNIKRVTREDEDKIAKAYKRAKKIVQSEYRNIW